MRTIFVIFLIVILCPEANAASKKRFDFLLYFFDMNETAFAYHRHCLSTTEGLDATFLRGLEFVADELFAEAKKSEPKKNPEYIKTKILERRYKIQYKLDHAHMEVGCNSHAIDEAKAHYEEFSRYNKTEIGHFIDEQTKD